MSGKSIFVSSNTYKTRRQTHMLLTILKSLRGSCSFLIWEKTRQILHVTCHILNFKLYFFKLFNLSFWYLPCHFTATFKGVEGYSKSGSFTHFLIFFHTLSRPGDEGSGKKFRENRIHMRYEIKKLKGWRWQTPHYNPVDS